MAGPDQADVAVVGSGPAGSVAALHLARGGARVILIERERLPRYKTCGGGVVERAMRLLADIDGLDNAIERRCAAAEVHLADARARAITRRPGPIVSMTMRATFDSALVDAARRAGARLETGCAVRSLTAKADHVALHTGRGPIAARFVIAADGALSTIARHGGWPTPPMLIPALEYEIRVGDHVRQRFEDTARFDFGLVSRGYAWVFPKGGHLSMGVLSARRKTRNLEGVFRRYLHHLGITRVLQSQRHGFLIPIRPRPGPTARGRILLTGDAAGFADPITAEGISFAILSGRMAAAAILDGELRPERVATGYQDEVAKRILPELRAGRMLARILYGPPALRRTLFRLHAQRLSEAMTDVMTGDATYRGILKNPVNYLRLLRPDPVTT